MIRVPDLGDRFHRMWRSLFELGPRLEMPWTLVGAQMVAVHGWAAGRDLIRPSQDADLLVNVRAMSGSARQAAATLLDLGYDFAGADRAGIGHRFLRDGVAIDLLAPDGAGERADLRTVPPARTVRVPGGTQALRRSHPLEVTSRRSRGSILIPSLLGALLVKVRAIRVDDTPDAQVRDVAFLLSLVEDPAPLASELTRTERSWLRAHPRFADPKDPCYRGIDGAEDASITFRRLTEVS